MPNYLVRIRSNGEAVGLFAVEDLEDLVFWVDEVTDPADCEYAEIGSGSVIWEGAAMRVPAPEHDWDNESRPVVEVIGKHSLGGSWMSALVGGDLEFFPCVDDAPANDA
jgi:hypothetical protein